jgi:DNA-binding FadR family transcriptional regulator
MGSPASTTQPAAPSLKRGAGSVHFSVAEAIGKRIVSGEFPPGTILPNETKWAADFNVSRSAVREAIKILMAKNLLVSRPKVGSRVEPKEHWNLLDQDVLSWYVAAPRQAQFLLSLQQFRYVVEPEAAALAAINHTEEQMQVITTACRDMGKATTLNARTEADVRFHSAILKATNNEFLMPLGVITDQSLNSLFIFITRHADDLRYVQKLHENIARNIRLRKPDAARQAVKRLLRNSDNLIDQYASRNKLDAAPDWTDGAQSQATVALTKEEKS